MKYIKILGLLAVAAAALMAFAGTASASVVTSPSGTVYTGELNAEIENGHAILHSENAPTPFTVECNVGSVKGTISQHGASVTAGGAIGTLTFEGCTNGTTVIVNKPGTLEAHAEGGGNAEVTSSGAEITVHVPLGFKCVYTTNNTPVGTLTGGTPGTLSINSSTIPRTAGSAFCGSGGFWTGSYKVTKPGTVFVS